jgi:UDP-N-acetylglucosamine:LPS N-acetylglucosamine transferase
VRGPRIAADAVPAADGVESVGFVEDLPRLLAACDVAVAQGGLTTTMELVAAGRPFVSVPLAGHFEQQIHVRHRLERHGATRSLDYTTTTAEDLADAIESALRTQPAYAPVTGGGASRAADLVARLL